MVVDITAAYEVADLAEALLFIEADSPVVYGPGAARKDHAAIAQAAHGFEDGGHHGAAHAPGLVRVGHGGGQGAGGRLVQVCTAVCVALAVARMSAQLDDDIGDDARGIRPAGEQDEAQGVGVVEGGANAGAGLHVKGMRGVQVAGGGGEPHEVAAQQLGVGGADNAQGRGFAGRQGQVAGEDIRVAGDGGRSQRGHGRSFPERISCFKRSPKEPVETSSGWAFGGDTGYTNGTYERIFIGEIGFSVKRTAT